MIQVKFLIEPEGTDPIMAYFPETGTCYNRIGQHSGCSTAYANKCKEANFNQYSDLLRELISIGYKELQILNKQEIEYRRQPTAYELKFGEGSCHYRSFTLSETGISKKGDLKKWFIADDNLRYYR